MEYLRIETQKPKFTLSLRIMRDNTEAFPFLYINIPDFLVLYGERMKGREGGREGRKGKEGRREKGGGNGEGGEERGGKEGGRKARKKELNFTKLR